MTRRKTPGVATVADDDDDDDDDERNFRAWVAMDEHQAEFEENKWMHICFRKSKTVSRGKLGSRTTMGIENGPPAAKSEV
jgi:hypothetical protein